MHAGAEVDQPLRPVNERGEHIGRERVDREHVRQPLRSTAACTLLISDRGVVNDRVEFPERVPAVVTAIFGGERDKNTPVSVVGASRLGGEAVENGVWVLFFFLLASLNFFIGVFNLLPLLPLDGGHIAVAWFEKLRSWLYARLRRPDPGRVDYLKLMPITYAVILVFGGFTLLTVAADIVNPVTVFGK